MGTKMIVYGTKELADLRADNKRLREQHERFGYVLLDMLEKLQALEASCKELLEEHKGR